jgi:hypothetical protein
VWWGYEKSQKVVNIRRDPRSTVMVDSGDHGYALKGVSITGRSEIVTDRDFVVGIAGPAIYSAMRHKEVDAETMQYLEGVGAKRVAVVLQPTRVRSWDHAKLNN